MYPSVPFFFNFEQLLYPDKKEIYYDFWNKQNMFVFDIICTNPSIFIIVCVNLYKKIK
jgi:hypothetical protein